MTKPKQTIKICGYCQHLIGRTAGKNLICDCAKGNFVGVRHVSWAFCNWALKMASHCPLFDGDFISYEDLEEERQTVKDMIVFHEKVVMDESN